MATTKITIKSNSAIKVEGDFEIVDGEGRTYDLGDRNVISLCRCGLSKNMPFCDGEHKGNFCHEAVAFSFQNKK